MSDIYNHTHELRHDIIEAMKNSIIFNGFTTSVNGPYVNIHIRDSNLFKHFTDDYFDIHFYFQSEYIHVSVCNNREDFTNINDCFSYILVQISRYLFFRSQDLNRLSLGIRALKEIDGFDG